MLLDVERLAHDILEDTLGIARQQHTADLARCLLDGNGAFRLTPGERACFAVLGSPLDIIDHDTPHYPIVMQVGATPKPTPDKGLLSTEEVAREFRRWGQYTLIPQGFKSTWAPAAEHSLSVLPIGGVTEASCVATGRHRTDQANKYFWFDLSLPDEFPVGHTIFHIDSKGQISLYQRVGDMWCAFGGVWQADVVRSHLPAVPITGFQEVSPELASRPRPLIFKPDF